MGTLTELTYRRCCYCCYILLLPCLPLEWLKGGLYMWGFVCAPP